MIESYAVADTGIDEWGVVGSGTPLVIVKRATRGRTEIA